MKTLQSYGASIATKRVECQHLFSLMHYFRSKCYGWHNATWEWSHYSCSLVCGLCWWDGVVLHTCSVFGVMTCGKIKINDTYRFIIVQLKWVQHCNFNSKMTWALSNGKSPKSITSLLYWLFQSVRFTIRVMQCNNVLLRTLIVTHESSMGCADITKRKWLCLVK